LNKLTRTDLYSLEQYAAVRPTFRAQVIAHKKDRAIAVGPHTTLQFEDRLTMQYQVQEMLRVERLYEPDEIQGELDAYNPLIPDGSNWKATFFIEYPEAEERHRALARLVNIEDRVWVRVGDLEAVYAIADEDMARETEEKTSSVHFLRFELTPTMVAAAKAGVAITVGIDHSNYHHVLDSLPVATRTSLIADLD
jgi:hypothetical protein